MYDHLADHMDDGEEEEEEAANKAADEIDMDAERFDRESSVGTPSERSAVTPDETLLNRSTFGKQNSPSTDPVTPLKIRIPDDEEVLQLDLDENSIVVPSSPRPLLQASLATLSDFRYDRYSLIMESPVSEVLSPELETDETFSPIETATPISFQLPKSRPSLISIVSISERRKRRTVSMQSPLSQTVSQVSERASKRLSTSSVRSGFLASEARPFEVPDLPDNAFELIANASQESLPLSTKETSRSRPERKSSTPRLSTALSHARMSSIKSFIKTPTSATPTRSFSRPSSHVSRPSTSSLTPIDRFPVMKNSAASTSSTNLPLLHRLPTSTSISSSGSAIGTNMTALPSLPTPPADEEFSDPLVGKPMMQRKKSFSALRRRSESIGQAIKGLGKITTKHEAPLPPTPALTDLRKQSALDLSRFPTPPLPSPNTGKSSAGSFSSSRTRSSGGHIGLGLRSVDGLR